MPVNVLVVQDEAPIASFIKRGLEAEGFVVRTASDGAEGLRLMRSSQFDLIILDLLLPSVSGEEVLARMREGGSSVPVIVLTAKDAVSDRVANLEAGADDYLTKPFSFAELLARVRARLRTADQAESTVISHGAVTLDLHARDCADRWTIGRAHRSGVCPTRDLHASSGRGLVAASAPGPGMGIRPRTELQRGRGLRGVSAQETPARSRRDGSRHGVPISGLTASSEWGLKDRSGGAGNPIGEAVQLGEMVVDVLDSRLGEQLLSFRRDVRQRGHRAHGVFAETTSSA